jgi:hypothetical protein
MSGRRNIRVGQNPARHFDRLQAVDPIVPIVKADGYDDTLPADDRMAQQRRATLRPVRMVRADRASADTRAVAMPIALCGSAR